MASHRFRRDITPAGGRLDGQGGEEPGDLVAGQRDLPGGGWRTGLPCALGQASQLDQFQAKYPDTAKRAI